MPWIMKNPHSHIGRVVADGHCVGLLQVHANVPHTSHWRRGIKARGGDIEAGTCIATFSRAGRYENRTDGSSHAAVFISEERDGLLVIDQWRGHPVAYRTIRFKGGSGTANNDGDAFHVIISAAEGTYQDDSGED